MAKLISFKRLLPDKGIEASATTIWRWEKEGKFPKHVRIGARYAWYEAEIDQWIEAREAERDAKQEIKRAKREAEKAESKVALNKIVAEVGAE
jgi:prophage regulatory protein